MITYHLGREESLAYARDFLQRLHKLDLVPTVWCPITKSGATLVELMAELIDGEFPAFREVRILPIEVGDTIRFTDGDPSEVLRGQSVLLLDGAIHSGKMMNDCAAEVLGFEPAALSSYALVMKRGSIFVPTFWGVMIEETDRAFFLLPAIPNQRLDATGDNSPRKQPSVHLERLNKKMLKEPLIESGVQSLDRILWSDRYFQMEATEHRTCTYLLKRGIDIAGYLTLHILEGGGLMVDEIAVHPAFRGTGFAGVLMRFADTMARQGNCPVIRLLAISAQVEMYKRFDFREVPGKPPVHLDNENYHLMEKVVLYHQSPIR